MAAPASRPSSPLHRALGLVTAAVLGVALTAGPLLAAPASAADTGSISGTVTAEGGGPLADVYVSGQVYDPETDEYDYYSDYTDSSGHYEIDGLPLPQGDKDRLLAMTPGSYTGQAARLAKDV